MDDKLDGLLETARTTMGLNPKDDIRNRLAESFNVLEEAARFLLEFPLPPDAELAQEFTP